MPALFVPTLDALRLALASGLVPGSAALAPGRAGTDAFGHLWLEPVAPPSREALTALNRLGVIALGSPGVPTEPVRSWAELLPPRRADAGAAGPILFDVPDRELAPLVARLRRAGTLFGVRLLPEPDAGRTWVTALAPPADLLLRADEPDSPLRAFHPQTPTVWTARRWWHPLATHLAVPPDSVLLCSPEGVACVAGAVPEPRPDEFPLPARAVAPRPTDPAPRFDVRFRLLRCDEPGDETLWVLGPAEVEAFNRFCRGADERLLRRFEVATVTAGAEARVVVRRTVADDRAAVLPVLAPGFCLDPRLPGLFVPAGFALRPVLRVHEAARALALAEGRLVWVEPAGRGVAVHALPVGAFRALHEQVEYEAPARAPLVAQPPPEETFPFDRLALQIETEIDLEPEEPEPEQPAAVVPTPAPAAREPGWMSKSFSRMMGWVLRRRTNEPSAPSTDESHPEPREDDTSADTGSGRVGRKLTSDALIHGHDRAARRRELENRLLADFPRLGADERAARWAELAGAYGATTQALDAAVCWTHALWECATPPEAWLEQWAVAEVRAAKRPDRGADLDRWLSEPARPGTGRVIAALTAYFGALPAPPPEFVTALPRVLAVLDQQFDDIPVRAGWLARLAAARSCDGDVLGLARWHDRLIRRLHDRGPGLDLDEPSFLRFRGTARDERFQKARKCLTDLRDPVRAWVAAHGTGEALEWAGLSAETGATAEYAQMMLAWGLGVLGERATSRDWSARARKQLANLATRSRRELGRVDPAGHAFLGDLFLHRIKDGHEGHAPKAALPAELQARYEKLPDLARYSADRLRDHSRILQPVAQGGAYRGLDLKEFWGTDRLGERLAVFAARTDPLDIHDEARALLALAGESPTTTTLPRIVLALLRAAGALDAPVVAAVLELVPTALDWVEAWVGAGRWKDAERADRVTRYQARIAEAAFAVATPGPAARLLGALARGAAAGPLLPAAVAVAPRAFRTARKFGLTAEAEGLVRALDPTGAGRAEGTVTPDRVALAIGWFAAGDEEAGWQILDAAKDALFDTASAIHARTAPDLARATALALAYAEALGAAPGAIALGRLEELFQPQRRVRVTVQCSSNCYYTLHPLRLIDTVVRSVVTDEFTLGTAVRAWLDEDEFLIRRRVHRDMAALLRRDDLM